MPGTGTYFWGKKIDCIKPKDAIVIEFVQKRFDDDHVFGPLEDSSQRIRSSYTRDGKPYQYDDDIQSYAYMSQDNVWVSDTV
jgi:hypothetical protein